MLHAPIHAIYARYSTLKSNVGINFGLPLTVPIPIHPFILT